LSINRDGGKDGRRDKTKKGDRVFYGKIHKMNFGGFTANLFSSS
jgi:hypothetical protein